MKNKFFKILMTVALVISCLGAFVACGGNNFDSEKNIQVVAREDGSGTKSAFMEMLLKILDVLSWAFVIGLTLFVIYKILKKFYQLYLEFDMNSVENGDEIEKIYTVQTKDEKRKLKKQKEENLRWDRSPNAKIRKHYKKRVLKDVKELPAVYMTPEEIECGVNMPVDKKQIFHTLYEQARYANVECSKEDMDKMLKI